MTATPAGYRRTGLCPTFTRPVLQRDGYLLRLALVGGLLDLQQLDTVTTVAKQYGSGTVELTNRGNLQVRGLATDTLSAALEACAAAGLGDSTASLVTISPFAGPAEHTLRAALLDAFEGIELSHLSPKFAAHVDDGDCTTVDRVAEALVQLTCDGLCQLTVRGLGTTVCVGSHDMASLVRRLAETCIAAGPHMRTADLVARDGPASLARTLSVSATWQPRQRRAARLPMHVQVGIRDAPSGQSLVIAGVRFGRIGAPTLAALSSLLSSEPRVSLRVTPWRALAFACHSAAQADTVLRGVGKLGLLIDAHDPSLGVVTCIGAHGCWETELDTLAEAERLVAAQRANVSPSAIVHVSGCDKRCATRGAVALTLLGRADQTGFDEVWPTSE